MKETIGIGILGTGMVADYHRQAIVANAGLGAQLVAVGHHDRAKFADASQLSWPKSPIRQGSSRLARLPVLAE